MHRLLVALAGIGLLGILGPAPAQAAPETVFTNLTNDPLYDSSTYQAMHDVMIDVSWNQVELRQVARDLTLAVRQAQPINTDINFFMSSSAPDELRHRRVSLSARRASVYDVLRALAGQAGFTIKIHSGIVMFAAR